MQGQNPSNLQSDNTFKSEGIEMTEADEITLGIPRTAQYAPHHPVADSEQVS